MPPPVVDPPDTTIDNGPTGRIPIGPVEFSFSSNEPNSTFECSLDGAAFANCTSPYRLGSPSPGRHLFRVRAIDSGNRADATPASRGWASVSARLDLCGPLSTNRTLSPDEAAVYVVTCPVVVPDAVIVELGAGTVVKGLAGNSSNSAHFVVASGGTLNVAGTAASPVVFTSLKDDSIAGDTGGDGPSVPATRDYFQAIQPENDATVTMTNAVVRYAYGGLSTEGGAFNGPGTASANLTVADSVFEDNVIAINLRWGRTATLNVTNSTFNANNTGISVSGAEQFVGNISATSIRGAQTAILLGAGSLSFRGAIRDSAKAISACNWLPPGTPSSECFVDAAYVDWGTARGPFLADGTPLVCGAVTIAPWEGQQPDDVPRLFASANCDGSSTPRQHLADSSSQFSQRVSARQIDCSNGFEDACQAIRTAYSCLSGAVDIAAGTTPFPLPPAGSSPDWPNTYGQDLDLAASGFISGVEVRNQLSLSGVRQFGGQLLGAIGSLLDIADAYSRCAP